MIEKRKNIINKNWLNLIETQEENRRVIISPRKLAAENFNVSVNNLWIYKKEKPKTILCSSNL